MGIDSADLNFHGSSKAFPPAFDAGESRMRVKLLKPWPYELEMDSPPISTRSLRRSE